MSKAADPVAHIEGPTCLDGCDYETRIDLRSGGYLFCPKCGHVVDAEGED